MEDKFDYILIGLSPQGLFILRELSRQKKKVLGIGQKKEIGIYSKYGQKICLKNFDELKQLIPCFSDGNTVVFINGDRYLNYLINDYQQVFCERKCCPNYNSAFIFRDKIETYRFAARFGLRTLTSQYLIQIDPGKLDEFPYIVKWNRRVKNEAFKLKILYSPKDVSAFLKAHPVDENLIIQKYISGLPSQDVSYGGYFKNGKELFGIVIQQKRQYPYPNGLASYVEEYTGRFLSRINQVSKQMMHNLKYDGFVEVEYRIDQKEKELYLIEVNPRACGWIKAIRRKYKNFDMSSDIVDNKRTTTKASWVNIGRDLLAVRDLIRKDITFFSLRSLIRDYLGKPEFDVFDLSDPYPFFSQIRNYFSRN